MEWAECFNCKTYKQVELACPVCEDTVDQEDFNPFDYHMEPEQELSF